MGSSNATLSRRKWAARCRMRKCVSSGQSTLYVLRTCMHCTIHCTQMRDIGINVLDEAHHCGGDHPFALLLRESGPGQPLAPPLHSCDCGDGPGGEVMHHCCCCKVCSNQSQIAKDLPFYSNWKAVARSIAFDSRTGSTHALPKRTPYINTDQVQVLVQRSRDNTTNNTAGYSNGTGNAEAPHGECIFC